MGVKRAVNKWSRAREGERKGRGGWVFWDEVGIKSKLRRTRSEEKPEEPHGHVGQVVIRRPGITAYLEPRKRRPVLREPKRAQPVVQVRILAQLPLVLPVVLQHHHIRRPEHLVHGPHPFLRHPIPSSSSPILSTTTRIIIILMRIITTATRCRLRQLTNRTSNPGPQPRKLHAPPAQFGRQFPGRSRSGT